MPTLPVRTQQPSPVSPQVELPPDFPDIPKEVLDRFPSAKDWQLKLDEFWTRSKQAIDQAQSQAASFANSRVTFTVDTFRIYVNGVSTPLFDLDATGVRLGGVLVVNRIARSVYVGAGTYQSADTPFYLDTLGNFSLGQNLTWNPDTATLSITGSITATTGSIGGFDIGTDYIRDLANSMGMASTVTGGDDVRFWAGDTFANRAAAPFNVTESGILTATNNAVIVGTVSGRLTATLAAAINAAGNLITDVVNPRLDSGSKTILSDFNFGAVDYAGAVKSGTITWNTTTGAITGGSGVVVYRSGIVGAAAGVATFTLDAATGDATFAGTLSAPDGTIGGWTINSTTLTGGNATLDSAGQLILGTVNDVVVLSAADATYRIWIGNAVAGSAAFNVTKAGVLTATGATITGSITATSGTIGGFDVGADYIRDTSDSFGLASDVTASADVRFWAGATFANRNSAPVRIKENGDAHIERLLSEAVELSGNVFSAKPTSISNWAIVQASGGFAYSYETNSFAFSADANGDSMRIINATASVLTNSKTGLLVHGLHVTLNNVSGAGTVASAYGIYIDTVNIGTANWGLYVATTARNFMAGDLTVASIGSTTPGTGAFTTLSASSTVSGAGFSTYLASPPAIGGSTPGTGAFTTLSATGAITGQSIVQLTLSGSTSVSAFIALKASLSNGNDIGMLVGSAASSNNSGVFGFVQDATTSYIDLHVFGDAVGSGIRVNKGGTIRMPNLSGVGSRTVVADASGNLSAP